MTVGYFDEYGVLSTQVFGDIRGSIVSGRGFAAGETDVVRVLIPGMSELRSSEKGSCRLMARWQREESR